MGWLIDAGILSQQQPPQKSKARLPSESHCWLNDCCHCVRACCYLHKTESDEWIVQYNSDTKANIIVNIKITALY